MRLLSLIDRIESASWLDPLGERLSQALGVLQRVPNGRAALSGTAFGHPLHPLMVTAPIGAWTAALVLDVSGGDPAGARRLVGAGLLAAVPTALSGASDWLDTEGAERRTGQAHAMLNLAATATYAVSWLVRGRSRAAGVATGLVGAGLATAAGWLGGHLVYGQGVGVDTNAFQHGPTDWAPLQAQPVTGAAVAGEVAGQRLAVTKMPDGPVALADRCSHRGGPLSEGEIVDGCFSCPWHGSRFDARTGRVRRGPASVPQPTYDVRSASSGLEARHRDERALRSNPV